MWGGQLPIASMDLEDLLSAHSQNASLISGGQQMANLKVTTSSGGIVLLLSERHRAVASRPQPRISETAASREFAACELLP